MPDLTTVMCLSHVRWQRDYQRPHHIANCCAKDHRVLYFEEPQLDSNCIEVEIAETRTGVLTVIPHLPTELTIDKLEEAQQEIVDMVLKEMGDPHPILWYYDPMALGYTEHVQATAVVYDRIIIPDRPSGQRALRESRLMKRADLIFAPDDVDLTWDLTWSNMWKRVEGVMLASGN
jgi:UDP-galactopyranose mutase